MTQPPPITPGYGPTGPQPPWPPAPRPAKKKNTALIWTLSIVGLVVVCCLGTVVFAISLKPPATDPSGPIASASGDPTPGATSQSSAAEQPPAEVTITSCTQDSIDALHAGLHIVNTTNRRRTYSISVAFEAADGTRIGQGAAFVSDLDPGQAADDEAIGFASGDKPLATCRVLDVTRF